MAILQASQGFYLRINFIIDTIHYN